MRDTNGPRCAGPIPLSTNRISSARERKSAASTRTTRLGPGLFPVRRTGQQTPRLARQTAGHRRHTRRGSPATIAVRLPLHPRRGHRAERFASGRQRLAYNPAPFGIGPPPAEFPHRRRHLRTPARSGLAVRRSVPARAGPPTFPPAPSEQHKTAQIALFRVTGIFSRAGLTVRIGGYTCIGVTWIGYVP